MPEFAGAGRVRWSGGTYDFEVHRAVPSWLPIATLSTTAERALREWSGPACSSLVVSYAGLTDAPAELGDGRNTIDVIVEGWEELGYEPDAVGATALEFVATDDGGWEIVEADILVNAEHHAFNLSDAPAEDGSRSLLGTLRHEGGHAFGLVHPCEEDGEDGAPRCDGSVPDSTIMYPFYESDQTELTPDDVAGICSLYPRCELEGCEEGFVCSDGACLLACGESACERDEFCVDGACLSTEECEASGCFTPVPAWITGCEASDVCPEGLCLGDGSCARQCAGDADCRDGRPCVFDADPNVSGYCGSIPKKQLGEACSSPAECADGECIAGAEARSVCTRACAARDPDCPSGWSCSSVEARPVCVPPRAPRGCAVSPDVRSTPGEPPLPWPLFVPLPLALLAARRRHLRRLSRTRSVPS